MLKLKKSLVCGVRRQQKSLTVHSLILIPPVNLTINGTLTGIPYSIITRNLVAAGIVLSYGVRLLVTCVRTCLWCLVQTAR